jgi:hypothetical protein
MTPSLQFIHANGTDDQDDNMDVDEEPEDHPQEPQPPRKQSFVGTCKPGIGMGAPTMDSPRT